MNAWKVKKPVSILLSVFLFFGSLSCFSIPASAAAPSASSMSKNEKSRHVVATDLSAQAKAYYTGSNTYENLILLDGQKAPTSAEAIGSPLFNRLHSMMQLTNTVSYSSLLDYWKKTDANASSSASWLFYSDRLETSGDGTNREHDWPKSHGNFGEGGAGSDLHHHGYGKGRGHQGYRRRLPLPLHGAGRRHLCKVQQRTG